MAMSQRPGPSYYTGAGSNSGRSQRNLPRVPATRPFYDDFRPVSEWKTEKEAFILLVRLPGFLKEQINYTMDDTKRYIRISGERALADNRRIRFKTTYTIPQTCNFNQITSHFDHGILKITIPYLYNLTTIPNTPQQNPAATTSQDKSAIKLEKGSTSTAVAEKESLEFKKAEYSADNKISGGAGKVVSEEENKKSDIDVKEKEKEGNGVKGGRGMEEVEKREEKQLMVNVCVAVMVILGVAFDIFKAFA